MSEPAGDASARAVGAAGAAAAGVDVADGLAGTDLAEVSARFGAALREVGLPVGPGRCR